MKFPARASVLSLALSALVFAPAAVVTTIATTDAAYAKSDKAGGGDRGNSGKEKADKSGGSSKSGSSGKSSNGKSGKSGGSQKSAKASTKATKTSNGSVASQLKWMNAAHASLNAYANASPNSRVGQIATYRQSLLDYEAAINDPEYQAELDAYREALAEFAVEGTTPEQIDAALAELQALDASGTPYTQEDIDAILEGLNPEAFAEPEAPVEDVVEEVTDPATDVVEETTDPLADVREALAGAVESDNEIESLGDTKDAAFDTVKNGLTVEEGTPAWDAFHEMLRLDESLPEKTTDPEVEAEVDAEIEAIEQAELLLVTPTE